MPVRMCAAACQWGSWREPRRELENLKGPLALASLRFSWTRSRVTVSRCAVPEDRDGSVSVSAEHASHSGVMLKRHTRVPGPRYRDKNKRPECHILGRFLVEILITASSTVSAKVNFTTVHPSSQT